MLLVLRYLGFDVSVEKGGFGGFVNGEVFGV
jgi:hypothetical protein